MKKTSGKAMPWAGGKKAGVGAMKTMAAKTKAQGKKVGKKTSYKK